MSAAPIERLIGSRRVLVVAGAGGVGKTTVAAALAVAAAAQGRRVLCLTIDPAQRLADRLGVDAAAAGREQRIDVQRFAAAGLAIRGELTLVMLDTKGTFDDLVRRHASSPEAAERILHNEFYEYVSTQLAGTQAYMAMEKVLSVSSDPRFDLVVLDTPPTSDALDFLDAPERLIETLDSPALRWLSGALDRSAVSGLNLVARSVALVLRGVARLTGRGFLERLAEFVTEVNELFGGFRDRARRVAQAFRGPEFGYVLVATPRADALDEAAFFAARLQSSAMRADALIVNRVRPPAVAEPSLAALRQALSARGLGDDASFAERVLLAARAENESGALERAALAERLGSEGPLARARIPLSVEVPAFAASVHDVAALVAVSRRLAQ